MSVSVVIPTYKRSRLLNMLLKSLPKDVETIVMNSDHLSLAQKRNYGFWISTGEYILFIDDDNQIKKGAIDVLVNSFTDGVGIVGMLGCYDDEKGRVCDGGSQRHYLSGITTDSYANKNRKQITHDFEVDEVSNAFMVKRRLFTEIGGFDEQNFPIDLDEADFCYRAKRLGYKIIVCANAITYTQRITRSRIPNFRRVKNAYYIGRNKILFQRKHRLPMWFMPIFIFSYVFCLLVRGELRMIFYFLKGAVNGFIGNTKNIY